MKYNVFIYDTINQYYNWKVALDLVVKNKPNFTYDCEEHLEKIKLIKFEDKVYEVYENTFMYNVNEKVANLVVVDIEDYTTK